MAEPGYDARRKAENQRQSGNYDGAIKTLEDYLVTDPHNNKLRMLLANILIQDKKDIDFGLLQLDAILDIDPDYDDARKALITVLKQKKKYNDETNTHFQILLKKYPNDVDLLHSYGIFCREQLLDFTTAKEYFEKCVELKPEVEMYRLSYASLLINDLRMYADGKIQVEKALEINTNNEKTYKVWERLQKKKYSENKGPRKGITSWISK